MFSPTVRCGNRPICWIDVADLAPQLGRACGRGRCAPPSRMSPSVMSIMRLTIRIAVVLPQPDGPTSTQISPAGTSSESSSTAARSRARIALGHVAELERGGLLRLATAPRDWAVVEFMLAAASWPRVGRPYRFTRRRRGAPACAASSSASSSGASSRRGRARGDQPVGEPGVLRQQRAVQVGADDRVRAAAHALEAVAPVVAVALEHAAERLLARPEVRAPAVVLEAGEHAARGPPSSRSTSIATLPISRGPSARGPSRGRRGRRPGSPRRRARSGGRAAGSRRRRRGRRAALGGGVQRVALGRTRSSAHRRWSRSWPPPR